MHPESWLNLNYLIIVTLAVQVRRSEAGWETVICGQRDLR